MIDDTILERIRKVQGYLKSNNPNEAAVAAAKLSEMLLKYNLTEADIPEAQRKHDPFVNSATDGDRLPEWRITIGGAVAKANLCQIVISGKRLQWLGRASNVEVAQYIYETTAADLQRICDGLWYAIRDALKGSPDLELVHGKTWKADFLNGAATGVRNKLEDELGAAKAENANVNALVVQSNREVEDYKAQQYPRLGFHSAHISRGGNAYGLGVTTGRNVSFKTGVGAGGGSAVRRLGRG